MTAEQRHVRWVLVTREAGAVISRAYFHTEEMALEELNRRQDGHIGLVRAYEIHPQEVTL